MSPRPDPRPDPRGLARRFAEEDSGAAILEFAVALPILVALFFGCFELGRALLIRQAMEGAVRGGARYLARVPDPTCQPACSPGADHAVRMTADRIVENTGLRPEAVSVAPLPAPPPGTVAMQASVAFEVAFLAGGALGRTWTLTARHQEQRVGQ